MINTIVCTRKSGCEGA